jgi:hypothetical protein
MSILIGSVPHSTKLLCEDGEARYLKPAETQEFLERVNNVLGLEKSL